MKRGIYILPNLVTTGNLFFGYLSVVHSWHYTLGHNDSLYKSGIYIIVAAFLDLLDGQVARRTNTGTRFGEEYDSLSDMVSFGLAPMMLLFAWGDYFTEELAIIGCFFHLACGGIRLARFNVQSKDVEKNYFQGLPIPVGGMFFVLSAMILKPHQMLWDLEGHSVMLLCMYTLPFLMVSQIPYLSSKSLSLNRRYSFKTLIPFIFIVMCLWLKPVLTFYILLLSYIASGPIMLWVRQVKKILNHSFKR